MQGKEILKDLLETQHKAVNNELAELSAGALHWQPDAEANSIAITVWHLGRVADFVLTHRLQGASVDDQHWFRGGWAGKTGYDPRGIGSDGMGILTGYTLEDVAALPAMSGDDLLAYHNEVYTALLAYLDGLADTDLDRPVPGAGNQRSVYFWHRIILLDATRHMGEIQALKAMWGRVSNIE